MLCQAIMPKTNIFILYSNRRAIKAQSVAAHMQTFATCLKYYSSQENYIMYLKILFILFIIAVTS